MEYNFDTVKNIKHAPVYFEQDLFFSFYHEKRNERGKKISKEITREILVDYVGHIDGLHKYQLCCKDCTVETDGWPSITSDLFTELDSIFSLLAVSADSKGNLIQLHNFPYLQHQWDKVYEQLLTEYDEGSEERFSLIKAMNALMQDYDTVLSYLKSASMYGLFFNGYWQQADVQQVQYGEELNHAYFEEEIHSSMKETATQQLVTIHITGKPADMPIENVSYTGSCTFINGALNHCEKKIILDNNTHINFSIRWIGLKQRFLQ